MNGIVIRKDDPAVQGRAKRLGLAVQVSRTWEIPWERTLFVAAGASIPWDVVQAGFAFIERWDMAAPLWRYDVVAADLGTPAERKRTAAIVKDLRVPVYAHELLFVRNSPAARAVLELWQQEAAGGAEPRLAFLRALYAIKPMLCALPVTWLAEVSRRAERDRRTARRLADAPTVLVRVEIGPGRFVRCRAGEEKKVLARYRHLQARRAGRRRQ